MTDNIEKLVRTRSRLLIICVTAFLIWQGGLLLQDLFGEQIVSTSDLVISFTVLAGSILWAGAMFLFLLYSRKVKHNKAQAVMNDEWWCAKRKEAFNFGYFMTLAALAMALMAVTLSEMTNLLPPLNLIAVIRLIVIVSIAGPFCFLLWQDRHTGTDT